MLEPSNSGELYACIFIASDSSVWTKKMCELKHAGKSGMSVGSKVSFKLPVQLIDEQGQQMIMGEQEYSGTVLFHSPGLTQCKEKAKIFCKLIDEKRGISGNDILDLLLKEERENASNMSKTLYMDCNVQSFPVSKTAEDDVCLSSKRRKMCATQSLPSTAAGLVSTAPAQFHAIYSLPSVSVKSELAGELRQRSALEDNCFQLSWEALQLEEDEDMGEGDEECSEEENPFAVLEKLIKENQTLRKENACLKQMLLAAQNSAPFRLFSQETRDSAAYYLRLVLENLERTVTMDSSPSPQAVGSKNSTTTVNKDKYLKPLIIDPDNPERYSQVLVDPNKLYNVVKKAREQKSHQEVSLLNGLIDLVFSTQELAVAHGLGLKGKDKEEKALNRVKVSACEAFLRQTCTAEGWKELSQVEFRRKFTAKICNARRDLKNSMQKSS
ncbi:uncharacterized protein LOC103306284 [Chrysemys picta bellii]|uniref:uncharacterized protein LOC103306284 n=1 Tax=Chrysemys picta bellii TaxID=8478 RepID=UPI00046C216E|nr:uncharacterized protein LOC103306284 [Chrysemys picta bellii]